MVKKITLLLIAAVAALALSGCEVKNPVEGVQVLLNTLPKENTVTVNFNDPKTKTLIEKNVTVRFAGPDADKILTLTSEPANMAVTKDGFIELTFVEGYVPSEENPVKLFMFAEADGYIPAEAELFLTRPGQHVYDVALADMNNLPEGTEKGENKSGKADQSGELTEDVTVNTPNGAQLKLAKGTKLLDRFGNPLTGAITTTLVFAGADSEGSVFLPNDMAINEEAGINPFGGVHIDVRDAQGNKAVIIENTASNTEEGANSTAGQNVLAIPVPDATVNPETGAGVANGDSIQVWGVNGDTGQLEKAGVSVVEGSVPEGMGKAGGKWHYYSYYYWSWYYYYYWWYYSYYYSYCYTNVQVEGVPAGYTMYLKSRDQYGYTSYHGYVYNNNTRVRYYRWRSRTFELYLGHYSNNEIIGSSPAQCGTTVIPAQIPGGRVDIPLEVTAKCDEDIIVRPNLTLRYKENGQSSWNNVYMRNGKVTLRGLYKDRRYWFFATYDGKSGWVEANVNGNGEIEVLRASDDVPEALVDNTTTPATLRYYIDLGGSCN